MDARLDPAVAAVRRAVRTTCADLEPGAVVVVACSGGADSTALAAATVFEGRKASWLVGAAVVDHGLQPGSAEVAAGVAERLAVLGCAPVDVLTVTVSGSGGPEAAARDARYAALDRLASSREAVVLVGHTRDDQAESVLLGLARGSGVRSVAGMPPARGRFRRPLLSVSRETTAKACAAEGLDVWLDPHNTDARFARSRVRHDVMPVLEAALGPGVTEALARTADLARADADALDALAVDVLERATTGSGALDIDVLAAAPAALRTRCLRSAALRAGCPAGDLTARHVAELDRLVTDWHGQRRLDLPGRVQATRDAGLLKLTRG